MTTFYDILKPYLSEPMIEDNQNDFGWSEVGFLDIAAGLAFLSCTVCLVSSFVFAVFAFLMHGYSCSIFLGFMTLAFGAIADVTSRLCQKKTDIFYRKTFHFVTTIKSLYEEHIEPVRIAAILEAQKVRDTLSPDSSVAQKIYLLEQAASASSPDFDTYRSVKAWLSTEAKYLELKEFMAAYQFG